MRLVQRYANLIAVPSYHFHPVFAREVAAALKHEAPNVVALEISEFWESELRWASEFWPTPVVSYAKPWFLPFIAGDSMAEASRLATRAGLPVVCVDLELAVPIDRPDRPRLPDAAFAPRLGSTFVETVGALEIASGPPAAGDLAREAHMAARLHGLMSEHAKVFWVGGMAHWLRLRQRLESRNFDGPQLPVADRPTSFRRMRLAPSALHEMTGRLPFQVAEFGRRPERFSDSDCLQKLALAAVKPDSFRASEIAAMLRFARNLVAQESLHETPRLWNLLTSASAMLGNEYAGRLASLALQAHVPKAAAELSELEYEIRERREEETAGSSNREIDPGEPAEARYVGEYRSAGEVLSGRPVFGRLESFHYRRLPTFEEIRRRKRNRPEADGSERKAGEKLIWAPMPDEETSYEAFVRYVLELAGRSQLAETKAVPLQSGLGDGIDVRATIRNWHTGEIYVREPERGNLRITNGLIDYTARTEEERLRAPFGGWIDPSLQNVGSASMESRERAILQSDPFHVQRSSREISLITLDTPTWVKGGARASFYDYVVMPLVHLGKRGHGLYDWLRIMFTFCRNKPFAYCSHYKPSARIIALGRQFGVRVVHLPLQRIARPLRERHQFFRFMNLTKRQWEEYLLQLHESRRAWTPADGGR